MINKSHFRLHANCIPVKGKYRSIICDLSLERYRIIPNELTGILNLLKMKSVNDVKKQFNHEMDMGIEKYIDLLAVEGWGHWTDEPANFTDLNMEWDSPFKIQNCIIDVSNFDVSLNRIEKFINQLSKYFCEAAQIRFFCKITLEQLQQVVGLVNHSTIRFLELYIEYTNELDEKILLKFSSQNLKLRSIIAYNAPFEKTVNLNEMEQGSLCFVSKKIDSETHCGIVDAKIFNLNISAFIESNSFNSCLNRKISLDKNGFLKNCPSMESNFGSIETTTIQDVLENPIFINLWGITKDSIDGCKDCEFRYICTDCRAYLEVPKNNFSRPLKCGYNLKAGTWDARSDNSLKSTIEINYLHDSIK